MTDVLSIIILAAGQGKRMYSDLPKVLHPLAGKPLAAHVLDCARTLSPVALKMVIGHGGERVRAGLAGFADNVEWVVQEQQLGTGHAVAQAMPGIAEDHRVLVLYGDVPLIRAATLARLRALPSGALALLTAELADPSGYGRIVRNHAGQVVRIVEQKDASAEQLAIREINSGILLAPAGHLQRWLRAVRNDNAQGEYYLTDIIAMAVAENIPVLTAQPEGVEEILGVNDRRQLAELERYQQRRVADALLLQGVSLADPARLDVRGELACGRDVWIDVNAVFEGRVHLGDRVRIGPNVYLRDAMVGADVEVLANSVIDGAEIGAGCRIGPFARIRPHTVLAAHAHVGNFVEIKQSNINEGSKINHLSYIGDTDMGAGVNIGAGTITCNYDGANKHRTHIGDRAFIGSNTQLVAPVRVGDGATIGAGSTITRDAPDDTLTLSRAPQQSVPGWQRPVKPVKKG